VNETRAVKRENVKLADSVV